MIFSGVEKGCTGNACVKSLKVKNFIVEAVTGNNVTHTFPIYCGIIDGKLDSKFFYVQMPYFKVELSPSKKKKKKLFASITAL